MTTQLLLDHFSQKKKLEKLGNIKQRICLRHWRNKLSWASQMLSDVSTAELMNERSQHATPEETRKSEMLCSQLRGALAQIIFNSFLFDTVVCYCNWYLKISVFNASIRKQSVFTRQPVSHNFAELTDFQYLSLEALLLFILPVFKVRFISYFVIIIPRGQVVRASLTQKPGLLRDSHLQCSCSELLSSPSELEPGFMEVPGAQSGWFRQSCIGGGASSL